MKLMKSSTILDDKIVESYLDWCEQLSDHDNWHELAVTETAIELKVDFGAVERALRRREYI